MSRYADPTTGSTILLGSEGFRLLPDLEALAEPEDCIVKKHYEYAFLAFPPTSLIPISCFSETGLADRLRKLGVTTVLITGVKADVCCLSSASGAIANGIFSSSGMTNADIQRRL